MPPFVISRLFSKFFHYCYTNNNDNNNNNNDNNNDDERNMKNTIKIYY